MIRISDKEFNQLSGFIHKNYGIHLKPEKKTLVNGRLHKVLLELGMASFSEYYAYLTQDTSGIALAVLVDKITTNHTFFMREAEHFVFFKDTVLPYWASQLKNRDLRTWCAASATGEEPYTLAMIIQDYFEGSSNYWDTKLLATDISQSALETARKGIYSSDRVKDLPLHWKNKYFSKLDSDRYQIKEQLRREVIYRKLNLMDEKFPFKETIHTIFCRNVMIYFDQPTKEKLVNKLYDILEPGGYLFIGHSESLNRDTTRFKYIKPAVYRKI